MNKIVTFRRFGRLPLLLAMAFCMAVVSQAIFVACETPVIVNPYDKEDDNKDNPPTPPVDTTSPVDPGEDTTSHVTPIDTVSPVDPGEDTTSHINPLDTLNPFIPVDDTTSHDTPIDTIVPIDPGEDTTSHVTPIDTVTPVDPGEDTTSHVTPIDTIPPVIPIEDTIPTGPEEPVEPHDTLGPDEKPAFLNFAVEGVEHCFMSDNIIIVVLPLDKSLENAEITYTANVVNVTLRKQSIESGKRFTFDQGKAYPLQLTAEDGRVSTFKVKVFRFDLPVLFLESDIVKSKTVWVENAALTLRYPSGDTVCYATRVKGRGNSTWNWPKKPYTLGLENRNSFFEMKKHKRWNLMANWKDHTLMRNDVGLEIARRTDLEWTPSGEFVELLMNGVHRGNYYLCEKIAIDKHRLDIHELTPSDDDVSGGYLIELALDEYEEATKKDWAGRVPYAFKSTRYNLPVVIKTPDSDEVTQEQYNYVYKYFKKVEDCLYSSSRFSKGEHWNYIDIETFADWYLAIELTGLTEPNQPKSCFMYKDRDGKLKAGPVWDFDWSTFIPGTDEFRIDNTLWYSRLLQDETFQKKLCTEWKKHRASLYGVLDYILMRKEQLKYSGVVDKKMWPFTEAVTHDLNGDEYMTFEDACDRMYNAYKERWEWMDAAFGK